MRTIVSLSTTRWTIFVDGNRGRNEEFCRRVACVFVRFLNVRSNSCSRLTMMVNVSEDRRGCEFIEPLKNRGRAYFFADHRDLTGCRYYVVGHCCRSRAPRVHRFTLALSAAWSGLVLSSSPLPSLLSRRTSRVRSPADLRSYIYCIEETRAAAFFAHAPPVMSGLQSPVCLSVRLSRGPVDRSPSMPPSREVPLRAPLPSPPPSLLLFFAHLAPSLFHLVTVDRNVGPYPDTRGPTCIFLAKFISHWHDDFSSFFLIRSIEVALTKIWKKDVIVTLTRIVVIAWHY